MTEKPSIFDRQHRLLHARGNGREWHAPPLFARARDQRREHRRVKRDLVHGLLPDFEPVDARRHRSRFDRAFHSSRLWKEHTNDLARMIAAARQDGDRSGAHGKFARPIHS